MAIASISPTTGKTIQLFRPHTDTEIEQALEYGARAFEEHRRSSSADRGAKMHRAADLLEADRERFARIISTEMGKIFRASVEEIEKCARGGSFYAEHAADFLRGQAVSSGARRSSCCDA